MTELIEKQVLIILYMSSCGLCSGIVIDTFRLFQRRFFKENKLSWAVICMSLSITIAFIVEEYLLKCQNGKVTFIGMGAFFIGLWLWYKYFYDIISLGRRG